METNYLNLNYFRVICGFKNPKLYLQQIAAGKIASHFVEIGEKIQTKLNRCSSLNQHQAEPEVDN